MNSKVNKSLNEHYDYAPSGAKSPVEVEKHVIMEGGHALGCCDKNGYPHVPSKRLSSIPRPCYGRGHEALLS